MFFVPTCGNFFWQDFQDYYYVNYFIHSYELAKFSEFTISEIGLPISIINEYARMSI